MRIRDFGSNLHRNSLTFGHWFWFWLILCTERRGMTNRQSIIMEEGVSYVIPDDLRAKWVFKVSYTTLTDAHSLQFTNINNNNNDNVVSQDKNLRGKVRPQRLRTRIEVN